MNNIPTNTDNQNKRLNIYMQNMEKKNFVTPPPQRSLFLGWAHKNRKGKK